MITPIIKGPANPSGEEPEPITEYAPVPGLEAGLASDDWALIRYVGQPIGEVIPLRQGLTIGRGSGNDLHLSDPEVSRNHARLEISKQRDHRSSIFVQDLCSLNGTFINGRKLEAPRMPFPLNHGDVLRVGGHAFKLKCMDEAEWQYHEAIRVQTSTDPLTGLANRSAVLAFLGKHMDLARRHNRTLSLVLSDLDHFKEINDRFGHATGDDVLQRFGDIAARRLRSSDLIGRIGGEEFLAVLPETQRHEAVSVAEDLRRALADEVFASRLGDETFQVTCCFGVAQFRPRDTDDGSLLARADVALYRAKSLGRNRVEADE